MNAIYLIPLEHVPGVVETGDVRRKTTGGVTALHPIHKQSTYSTGQFCCVRSRDI